MGRTRRAAIHTNAGLKRELEALAAEDADLWVALERAGAPEARHRATGFPSLLRTIVGQQLSVKAAATIHGRVVAMLPDPPTPASLAGVDDEALRGAGLSRRKVTYVRSLAAAVGDGSLDLDALPKLDDEEAIKAITQVKGLGRWSAEMYLIFALGRPDIWPVDDLGVRVGTGRMLGLEERPTARELRSIGERWSGRRSAVALLAWHFISAVPLESD